MCPDNEYKPLRIPPPATSAPQSQQGAACTPPPSGKADAPLSQGPYYEIEYDSCPIPGVGRYVLKPQKIAPPETDGIRQLFSQMRSIARQYSTPYTHYSRFYGQRTQRDTARIFYRQALLMKDFEDDYPERASFSSYYPYYQMLGYEQLRTYFTWRTQVRRGVIQPTDRSYAFLYLYELLNQVGTDSPQDGADKLAAFWKAYQAFDPAVVRYLVHWLKDYYIYYAPPQPFWKFVDEKGLADHYPDLVDEDNRFSLYCAISKYNIRRSKFYTAETGGLLADGLSAVLAQLRQSFALAGMDLDGILFCPGKKLKPWMPFSSALFYPRLKLADRCLVFSEKELYLCKRNQWYVTSSLTDETGGQLMGYIMKRLESTLRTLCRYKYKLGAPVDMAPAEIRRKLEKAGLSLEDMVQAAVTAFYRDATRTVVAVDPSALTRIRQEAEITREALLVEEPESALAAAPMPPPPPQTTPPRPAASGTPPADEWARLREALSQRERQALALCLRDGALRHFADQQGVMLEVLADGINEKAVDHIGDELLDGDFHIYEDYADKVRGMVE